MFYIRVKILGNIETIWSMIILWQLGRLFVSIFKLNSNVFPEHIFRKPSEWTDLLLCEFSSVYLQKYKRLILRTANHLFYRIRGKWADGSPVGKHLPPPKATHTSYEKEDAEKISARIKRSGHPASSLIELSTATITYVYPTPIFWSICSMYAVTS